MSKRKPTWRQIVAPVIAEVLKRTRGLGEKQIRAELRQAYPLGERRYWPYKVWLSEVRRQLRGTTRPIDHEPYPLFPDEPS